MEKMFIVSGYNILYFLLAENEKDARAAIRDGENLRECDYSQAFTIRYGYQPLYRVRKGVDRLSRLDYITTDRIDKREFLAENPDVYTERKFL